MIDIRKLKELVRLMVSNELTELDLRDEQEQVTIKRPHPQAHPMVMSPATFAGPAPVVAAAPAPVTAAPAPAAAPAAPAAPKNDGTVAIESPMVGTFYSSPGPDKPAFVSVGSRVGPDTVVCLLEAMKIFNEIKAEKSGTIEAVLVKSGQPVEFGQPLFRIRPD
jgi:acetyl-CoA carboxylase biotin carboxyl carrier protein